MTPTVPDIAEHNAAGRLLGINTDVFLALQAARGQGPEAYMSQTQQGLAWGGLCDLGDPNGWDLMAADESDPELLDFVARPPHVLPAWSLPLQCFSYKSKLSHLLCYLGNLEVSASSDTETLLPERALPTGRCSCAESACMGCLLRVAHCDVHMPSCWLGNTPLTPSNE